MICCLVNGMRKVALSQKPGGMMPASGSAAARRSASSSLDFDQFAIERPHRNIVEAYTGPSWVRFFLIDFALMCRCLPSRNDPNALAA